MSDVEQVVMWRTADGELHSSKEAAYAHIYNDKLRDALNDLFKDGGQDILNFLSGRAEQVRLWLHANEAAMKKSLEQKQ